MTDYPALTPRQLERLDEQLNTSLCLEEHWTDGDFRQLGIEPDPDEAEGP